MLAPASPSTMISDSDACQPSLDASAAAESSKSVEPCALSVHELESHDQAPATPIDALPANSEEFTRQCKEWHRRRLQDRWRCRVDGHSYCFRDDEELHIQLSEASLDEWADNMVGFHRYLRYLHQSVYKSQNAAYATLLYPPESIIPSSPRSNADSSSLHGFSHRSAAVTYHRPFHFQLDPSLTDLRSWRNSLSSDGDGSSTSSGVPEPGCLAGNGIKWLGGQVLGFLAWSEMRRRIWVDKRLIKQMEKKSSHDVRRLLSRKQKSFFRLVNDLLELSSYDRLSKFERSKKVLHSDFVGTITNRNTVRYPLNMAESAITFFGTQGWILQRALRAGSCTWGGDHCIGFCFLGLPYCQFLAHWMRAMN